MLIAGSFFERWSKNYGLNYILFLRIPNLAGAVLGHDCAEISVFHNHGTVYGSTKKCNEKGVLFNTKIQVQGDHRPSQTDSQKDGDTPIVLYSQRLGLDLPVKI